MAGLHHGGMARWWALMLASLFVVAGAGSAAASEQAGTAGVSSGLVPTGQSWQLPADARNDTLWTWPEQGRGFLRTPGGVVSVDLRSGQEIDRVAVTPGPWYSTGPNLAGQMAAGREHTMAFDRAGGRLYLPFIRRLRGNDAWIPLSLDSAMAQHAAAQLTERQVCVSEPQVHTGGGCVGGYHVLDAETLAVVGSVRLENLQADLGTGIAPILRAIVHAPAQGDESSAGKLHILLEDIVTQADANLFFASVFTRVYGQSSILRLAQVDAATGAVDWITRIESCRGTRDEHTDLQWANDTMNHAWPTVAMRSTDPADRAIYVGCNNGGSRQAVIVRVPIDADGNVAAAPVQTAGAAPEPPSGPPAVAPPAAPVGLSPRQQAYPGPEFALEFRADPAANRLLVRVNGASTELWWVFDAKERAYVGAIGIGSYLRKEGAKAVFDFMGGRLYIVATDMNGTNQRLFVADTRRTPIAQAMVYPLPEPVFMVFPESAAPSAEPRRLFVVKDRKVQLWLDHVPLSRESPTFGIDGTTLDIPELPGVTAVAFDGSARGYGVRMLFVGGAEGTARVGAVDPLTTTHDYYNWKVGELPRPSSAGPWNPCLTPNRELVLAFVGPDGAAAMNTDQASGGVQPLIVDPDSAADANRPDRCAPREWDDVWQAALFGRAPADAPTVVPADTWDSKITCTTGEQKSWRDQATGAFAADVSCEQGDASGWAQARGVQVEDLSVSEAVSSFHIYRDPTRGLVSRVESVARGVVVAGTARIDTIRGTAEAWANGRTQPVAENDRDAGYEANCDLDRTAGTCFSRQVFGFASPVYSCGPCGDEDALISGLNSALGADGKARFRQPDARLAIGAANGYGAALVKPDSERFADLLMNEDLLLTTLPTLEIVRFASSTQYGPSSLGDPGTYPVRGRQIIQLAGVEVSSTYGIECLLVYDPARNVCDEPPQPDAALVLQLADAAGAPLTGGVFTVRHDADADGVVGLTDALVEGGGCRTGDDSLGCRLALPAGAYLIEQVAAPEGFAALTDPYAVVLEPGEERTVVFTNVSDRATVRLTVTDEGAKPVEGAAFALYRDADGDGVPDDDPAGQCTSDAAGSCDIVVPVGPYVLVQTAGPTGFTLSEPVAFAFTAGGQVASVDMVLPPMELPQLPPAAAAAPVIQSPPPPSVTESTVQAPVLAAPAVPSTAVGAGTIVRVLKAPGDALRMVARSPREGAAWAAVLLLAALAIGVVARRERLLALVGDR